MNRLSAKEKHIYVTQGLQRQGAYKKDFQYPEAIDIALNKAESRIIKDRLFPLDDNPDKFEINQKFVSDIQVLIQLDVELKVFKEGKKSYGVLPYDFSYLLSNRSLVVEDCKEGFTNSTESKSERVVVIPFTSAKTVSPYYTKIVAQAATATKQFDYPTGYVTKEEKVYLVDKVISMYKELGYTVYWETYKDIYRSESFLLITYDLTVSFGLSVDMATVVTSNIDNPVTVFKLPLVEGSEVTNRDMKVDFVSSAQSSYYHKTSPVSPISVIGNNKIIVYSSERFLVNKILLNYIRKPKPISLALNQGSELSATVHEEICDLAIQLLKKQIEDPSYSQEVQDNRGRID